MNLYQLASVASRAWYVIYEPMMQQRVSGDEYCWGCSHERMHPYAQRIGAQLAAHQSFKKPYHPQLEGIFFYQVSADYFDLYPQRICETTTRKTGGTAGFIWFISVFRGFCGEYSWTASSQEPGGTRETARSRCSPLTLAVFAPTDLKPEGK